MKSYIKHLNKIFLLFISFLLLSLITASTISAGEKPVKNVLIVYGSFAGSTREISEKMKSTLDSMKCRTELMQASDRNIDLTRYDLIIIGSAIRAGKPHPDVLKFIGINRAGLKTKKTAVFVTCMSVISEKAENREKAVHYPENTAAGLNPVSTAVFAGVVPDKLMMRLMVGKPGDYRDWKKIDEWTKSLPGLI